MKKVLKILGLILGLLILIVAGAAAWIGLSPIPSYENKAPKEFTVTSDSAAIAEGARMASMLCVGCHESEDGKLGGAYMPDTEEFGKIWSPNITQHPEHGITDYTDGELAYLLRTGILKDGQYSPPWMPKFPNLSDTDLNNIIAFLRSDHPLVQPSDNVTPEPQPSFLAKFLCRVAFKPLPYPENPIPDPDTSDMVAFGKYVSTAKYDCYGCHSASFTTFDPLVPENTEGFFGGGNEMKRKDGSAIISPNLTMDEATGIGSWTEEDFVKCLRTGIRPNGEAAFEYPMQPFAQMTDKEAASVWAYLQTLPKISNEKLAK